MIFSVRTKYIGLDWREEWFENHRWGELIYFACDHPYEMERTWMSRHEGRCVLERGHDREGHICDLPDGRRISWVAMSDEEWAELHVEVEVEGD